GKSVRACDLLKELHDLALPGQLPDGLFHLLRQEWRGVIARELFVLLVELRISERLAERLPQNLCPLLERARRQNVRGAYQTKGAEHGQRLALLVAPGKSLDLRQGCEAGMGMLIPLGNFQDGVDVNQAFGQ